MTAGGDILAQIAATRQIVIIKRAQDAEFFASRSWQLGQVDFACFSDFFSMGKNEKKTAKLT